MPEYIRIDKGTETGTMTTMHTYLSSLQPGASDDEACQRVLFGPSTSNQIERWWKELHERLEKFYKKDLNWLKTQLKYDPDNEDDRQMLAFILIPVIQREIDIFKNIVWNNHRIRQQKDTELPSGIPNHIFDFPEEYGMKKCGIDINDDQLKEVADLSGVLEIADDYLENDVRKKYEEFIPDPSSLDNNEWVDAYIFLKQTCI